MAASGGGAAAHAQRLRPALLSGCAGSPSSAARRHRSAARGRDATRCLSSLPQDPNSGPNLQAKIITMS